MVVREAHTEEIRFDLRFKDMKSEPVKERKRRWIRQREGCPHVPPYTGGGRVSCGAGVWCREWGGGGRATFVLQAQHPTGEDYAWT